MNEEQMDQTLRKLAADYNDPPDTPRDAMWQRIEAARRARIAAVRPSARPPVRRFPLWQAAAALAAVLVMGIAIGRGFAPEGPGLEQIVATGGNGGSELGPVSQVAYRVAASEHLTQVETFLALFQADAAAGSVRAVDYVSPARGLLLSTRLLQDSPVAGDLALRTLLDDIELVLAQIAQFDDRAPEDLEFIDQGIEHRGVLLKLRSAIPAGPAQVGVQGAL